LLYKGYTIQPYSPGAGTGLSSHELNQPGTYKDVKDTSVVAQFKARRTGKAQILFVSPANNEERATSNQQPATSNDVFFLAWTTTPWTLPGNSALTVGKNIRYARIRSVNPYTFEPGDFILAKDLVSRYFSPKGAEASLEDFKPGDKVLPWRSWANTPVPNSKASSTNSSCRTCSPTSPPSASSSATS
jgi:isoleucyl-tRNA synthetase